MGRGGWRRAGWVSGTEEARSQKGRHRSKIPPYAAILGSGRKTKSPDNRDMTFIPVKSVPRGRAERSARPDVVRLGAGQRHRFPRRSARPRSTRLPISTASGGRGEEGRGDFCGRRAADELRKSRRRTKRPCPGRYLAGSAGPIRRLIFSRSGLVVIWRSGRRRATSG